MIPEDEWRRAADALEGAGTVAIACHINPDGDALGSMLGLGSFLRRWGKKVWESWGSGEIMIPPQYETLPGTADVVHHSEVPEDIDVFVAIDCGDIRRLEALLDKFGGAKVRLNIDHHASNDHFGDINIVDPQASSSSELTYLLIRQMGGELEEDEATCLYTGIVTDTGRFQYSNTTPQTLRTAAQLREMGVDHTKVAVDVFESASFDYLHSLGTVLSRARLDDGVIWSYLNRDDLGDMSMEEAEDFIDILRSVREGKVAVILKEMPNRAYRVSLRSRDDSVDVSEIARHFGGGGHRKAAGCTMRGSPEECVAAIRERLSAHR